MYHRKNKSTTPSKTCINSFLDNGNRTDNVHLLHDRLVIHKQSLVVHCLAFSGKSYKCRHYGDFDGICCGELAQKGPFLDQQSYYLVAKYGMFILKFPI